MKKISILFLLLTCHMTFTYSQASKKPGWEISNVQVSMGEENSGSPIVVNQNTLSAFAPGSEILQSSSALVGDGIFNAGDWSSTLLNVQLGLHPLDDSIGVYRKNRTLRIGLSIQEFLTPLYSYDYETRTRQDTLRYTGSDQIYGFVDSTRRKNTYMDYEGTAIKFDVALLWSTDPERRFSLYAGTGFQAGFFFNARTSVYYDERSRLITTNTQGAELSSSILPDSSSTRRAEEFQNKAGGGLSLYLPLGVDFRLGKHKGLWQQLHLFTEFRPTLSIVNIPESKAYIIPGMQSMLGIKVHW